MKLCWFYKKAIAWAADSQSSPPRWVERHLAGCSECRRFHQAETRLAAALTSHAHAHLSEFPALLHARSISAVRAKTDEGVQPVQVLRWFRAAIAPALGLLLVIGFIAWKPTKPEPLTTVRSTPTTPSLEQFVPKAD